MWPMIPWGKSSSRRDGSFPLVLLRLFLSGFYPPQEVNDPRVKVNKCSVGPGDFGKLMKIAATLTIDPVKFAQ